MESSFPFRTMLVWVCVAGSLAAQQRVALYGRRPPNSPASHAIGVLEQHLGNRGAATRWVEAVTDAGSGETLVDFSLSSSGPAESFAVAKTFTNGRRTIAVAGRDEVGLAYGVFELLGQIECAPNNKDVFEAASDTRRTSRTEVRSIAMSLHNRELEEGWFYSREFWNSYFELLARSRFNQFTLIFGHQTPYFAPVFPFMVDVPGYERVKTPDFSAQDRARNLAALKMISQLAGEWGIDFILGMWQFNSNNYGRNLVDGLSYDDLFDYCPKAMAILLRQCPEIKGVQFRMNSESGIREDDQNRFFRGMAASLRSAGRPMWVGFRAKGLRAETIASANAVGLHPTVLTKYWREHMGLPFQGTRIDSADKERSYRRYGYWDLLYHDRPFNVLYELWSFGSQKILLWGGLDYARQFAASAHLGGSEGFEVFTPLSQRGYGNWPGGAWHLMANRDIEYTRWELERYWAFYLTFGLAGYSDDARQPILEAEFHRRFGPAWQPVQQAYEAASHVLPFITAVRAPSASSFGYWPELDTCGLTDFYASLGTGDDNLFYTVPAYVGDVLKGVFSAKMTPEQMAGRLENWAAAIQASLHSAEPLRTKIPGQKEFSSTEIDFKVDAELARYHAERLNSATDYEFFKSRGDRQRLLDAIGHYRKAVAHWEAIAQLTSGVYYDHMVFNRPPEQVGHWKDELPLLQAELARLEEIDRVFVKASSDPSNAAAWKIQMPHSKMTMKWKDNQGVIERWADTTPVPDSADILSRYSMEDPRFVVKGLFARLRYAKILHAPVRQAAAGAPLAVNASLLGDRQGISVTLHYRYSGRGFQFTRVNMTETHPNIYSASIPASPSVRIYYYIQAAGETNYFDGSEKEPHVVLVRDAGERKPVILHTDIRSTPVGADIHIRAKVRDARPVTLVRLYYRHLDQSEDWIAMDMKTCGESEYEATIPAEFVVPKWDVSYRLEALDDSGNGAIYPDFDQRDPFVVVQTK